MYVKLQNGAVSQYPYTLTMLRRDNPNTSFPQYPTAETLAEWDVHEVVILSTPSFNERTQKLVQETSPSLSDGVWQIGWNVVAKTDQEVADYDANKALENKAVRNRLLSATDFYALADVSLSDEMRTYRQNLRDITTHANWPNLDESDWPVKP